MCVFTKKKKISIGNVEAKELICMTHGHELKGGDWQRGWGLPGGEGDKGEKLGQL